MVTTVYMVRHAHSDYTPDERNRPLSERGEADARRVAELLGDEGIRVFISSPYKRAAQTIEGLVNACGGETEFEEDFRERLLAEGPVGDFERAIAKVWEDYSFRWEGGESNLAAQRRGVRALTGVLQRYEGESIVIGTHGNMMALIMNAFEPRFGFAFWQQLDMPDIYKLSFDGTKLTDVRRIWSREPG